VQAVSASKNSYEIVRTCESTKRWKVRNDGYLKLAKESDEYEFFSIFEPSYDYWWIYHSCIWCVAVHRWVRQNSLLSLCCSLPGLVWKWTACTIIDTILLFQKQRGKELHVKYYYKCFTKNLSDY